MSAADTHVISVTCLHPTGRDALLRGGGVCGQGHVSLGNGYPKADTSLKLLALKPTQRGVKQHPRARGCSRESPQGRFGQSWVQSAALASTAATGSEERSPLVTLWQEAVGGGLWAEASLMEFRGTCFQVSASGIAAGGARAVERSRGQPWQWIDPCGLSPAQGSSAWL